MAQHEDVIAASVQLDAHHEAKPQGGKAGCVECGFMTAVVTGGDPTHLVTDDELRKVPEWLASH